jgi:tape measure domain-containing protein
MITVATMTAVIGANTVMFDRAVRNVRQQMALVARQSQTMGYQMTAAVSAPIVMIAKQALAFDDLNKRSHIAFTTILRDGKKAARLIEDLKVFAKTTPYGFDELLKYSQRFLAMGLEAHKLIPVMTAVGNAVAQMGGTAEVVNRVTYALGNMLAAGRVTGYTLRQLYQAGINGTEALAKAYGVTSSEMRKMVSRGIIPAQSALNILTQHMETKAPDAMLKMNETIMVGLSNLHDYALQAAGALFEPLYKDVVKGIGFLQLWFDKAKMIAEGWSDETKKRITTTLAAFAAIGPALLALSAIARGFLYITTPLGLISAALVSMAAYLANNKQVAAELGSAMASILPDGIRIGQAAIEAFKTVAEALLPVVKSFAPILKTIASVIAEDLEIFNRFPDWLKTSIIYFLLFGRSITKLIGLFGGLKTAIKGAIGAHIFTKAATFIGGIPGAITGMRIAIQGFMMDLSGLLLIIRQLAAGAPVGATALAYASGIAGGLIAVASALLSVVAVIGGLANAWAAYGIQKENIARYDTEEKIAGAHNPGWYKARIAAARRKGEYSNVAALGVANMEGMYGSSEPLDFARRMIKAMGDSIATPAGQASCAYFVSSFVKASGKNMPKLGGAKAVADYVASHGGHQTKTPKPGDLIVISGPGYGAIQKNGKRSGYHVASYLGKDEKSGQSYMMDSSGDGPGNVRVKTMNQVGKGSVQFFAMPEQFSKNALKNTATVKAEVDARDALNKKYKELASQQERAVALFGKEGVAAAMRWDLENTEMKGFDATQKAYLMNLANQQDAMKMAQDATQRYNDMLGSLGVTGLELASSISLGVNATEAQRLAWRYAHESLAGMSAEQVKKIKADQAENVQLQKRVDIMRSMQSIRDRMKMAFVDEEKKAAIDAVGGLPNWQALDPKGQQEALDSTRFLARKDILDAANKQLAEMRTKMVLMTAATSKASQVAANSVQNWDELTPALQRSFMQVIAGTNVLEGLKGEIESADKSLLDLGQANKTATAYGERFIANLLEINDAAGNIPGLENLIKRYREINREIDENNFRKWEADFFKADWKKMDTFRAQLAGVYDPAKAAAEDFIDSNEEMFIAVETVFGSEVRASMEAYVAGMIKTQHHTEQNVNALRDYRNEMAGLEKIAMKMNASNPFEAWLADKYVTDENGKLKLPAGISEGDYAKMFNESQRQENLQRSNQMLGEMKKKQMEMLAINPFERWKASLLEINQYTGELTLPGGISGDMLRNLFDKEQILGHVATIADGISSLFGDMVSDTKMTFGSLFGNIYAGFQQMLFKMAVEYLQSQLYQALMSTIGRWLGVGAIGASAGAGTPVGVPGLWGTGDSGLGGGGEMMAVANLGGVSPGISRSMSNAAAGARGWNPNLTVNSMIDGGMPTPTSQNSEYNSSSMAATTTNSGGTTIIHNHYHFDIKGADPQKWRTAMSTIEKKTSRTLGSVRGKY